MLGTHFCLPRVLAIEPGNVSVCSRCDGLSVVCLHASGCLGLRCFDVEDGFAGGQWIARPVVNQLVLSLMIFWIVPHSLPEFLRCCFPLDEQIVGLSPHSW